MKKIISLLLALVMVMGLSVTAFATEYGEPSDATKENATITAEYKEGSVKHNDKYRINVTWAPSGSIKYSDAVTVYNWSTTDLKYVEDESSTTAGWVCDKAAIKIDVTNYSSQGVKVSCAAPTITDNGVKAINGTYTDGQTSTVLNLGTADNERGTDGAGKETTDTTTFSINSVEGKITAPGTIGTITISIEKATP